MSAKLFVLKALIISSVLAKNMLGIYPYEVKFSYSNPHNIVY